MHANLELYIQNNTLDFPTIESKFTSAGVHPFKVFEYSPQRNPLTVPSSISVQPSDELIIEAPPGGNYGVYQ
jgi:hypothetical protein